MVCTAHSAICRLREFGRLHELHLTAKSKLAVVVLGCSMCDYASIRVQYMRRHLRTSIKIMSNCDELATYATLHINTPTLAAAHAYASWFASN